MHLKSTHIAQGLLSFRSSPIGIIERMARGWESKSVEAQMEAAAESPRINKSPLTSEQASQLRRKERILLARKHVLQQLQNTQNPRHRRMLEQALADLDTQLAKADL